MILHSQKPSATITLDNIFIVFCLFLNFFSQYLFSLAKLALGKRNFPILHITKQVTFITIFYYIFIILVTLLSLSIARAQVIEAGNCPGYPTQCWSKTFIPGGTLLCGDSLSSQYHVSLNENFVSQDSFDDNWLTIMYGESEMDHPNSRITIDCEEQLYFDNQVVINNNKCIINGNCVPNSTWTWIDPNDNSNTKTYTRHFLSGVIRTKDYKNYHYGRYEITVDKMPDNGWWPAFWLWHGDEIDIMERFSFDDHYGNNIYSSTGCSQHTDAVVNSDTNLFSGPHTFGMELTPFRVTFYYNGQALPGETFRYINLDGTPLKVECGDPIPEGYYYLNPYFPQLSAVEEGNGLNEIKIESRHWRPIINLAVLPKSGLSCCDHNSFCYDDQDCMLMSCSDWGSPLAFFMVDMNGNLFPVEQQGKKLNTQFILSNVKIEEQDYKTDHSLAITYDKEVCASDSVINITLSRFGVKNLSTNNFSHEVNSLSIEPYSSNLGFIKKIDDQIVQFKPLATGNAFITISYWGDYSSKRDTIVLSFSILDNANCESDSCLYECCPPNTFFDGVNCYYGNVPELYSARVENVNGDNYFVVEPDTLLNNNHKGCPLGYSYNFSCNCCVSTIKINNGFEGSIFDNKYYAKPECSDIRDCCPQGYEFDGENCNSGIHFPYGYEAFILENAFYVKPNCEFSDTTNNCCPLGFVFDGINCHSQLYIPESFEGFILDTTFYVKPYCKDTSDCCPVGAKYTDQKCLLNKIPIGFTGFINHNHLYVYPLDGNICPDNYTFNGRFCDSGVSIPNIYHPFILNNELFTYPQCPQDSLCCPKEAIYEEGIGCWYADVPSGFTPFIYGNSFYVEPSSHSTNNGCPPGYLFDGVNCHSQIYFSEELIPIIYYNGTNSSFYTTPHIECNFNRDRIAKDSEVRTSNASTTHTIELENVYIYPNPTTSIINVYLGNQTSVNTQLQIVDSFGRIVNKIKLSSFNNDEVLSVDISSLSSGIYTIILDNGFNRKPFRFLKI